METTGCMEAYKNLSARIDQRGIRYPPAFTTKNKLRRGSHGFYGHNVRYAMSDISQLLADVTASK